MLQAMKIPDAKAAVEIEWDKLEKVFAWQMEKVVSKRHFNLEAQKERQNESPLCYIDGHVSSPECRVRTKALKVQRLSRATMRVRHSQNKDRQPRKCFFQMDVFCEITRMRWTSRRRCISLRPGKNEGRSQTAQNSKVRVSRHVDTSSTTQVAQILVKHRRRRGFS